MFVGFKVGHWWCLCAYVLSGGHAYSAPSPEHIAKRVGGRFSSLEDDVDDVEDRMMVAPMQNAGKVGQAGSLGALHGLRMAVPGLQPVYRTWCWHSVLSVMAPSLDVKARCKLLA